MATTGIEQMIGGVMVFRYVSGETPATRPNELSDRLVPFGITSNAVHPGTVASNFAGVGDGVSAFFFKLFRPFFKTVEQGAATSIYLASSPDVEGVSGNYFVDCKPGRTSSASKNRKLGKQLWKLSEDLVAKYENDHI